MSVAEDIFRVCSRKDHMARRFARPRNQICCGATVVRTGKERPTMTERSAAVIPLSLSRVAGGTGTAIVALPEKEVPSQ